MGSLYTHTHTYTKEQNWNCLVIKTNIKYNYICYKHNKNKFAKEIFAWCFETGCTVQ